MRRLAIAALVVCVSLFGLTACGGGTPASDLPVEQVSVLVDLSETWHNDQAGERNFDVLAELGYGIAQYAVERDPPFAIQYFVIGRGSLEREPECDTLYLPGMTGGRKSDPDYLVRRPKKLRTALGMTCPYKLLGLKPEPLTEIWAAIATANAQPHGPRTRRTIIIVSDFLEETLSAPDRDIDLNGIHVLMLYRPLSEDQLIRGSMRQRLDQWSRLLVNRGATVETLPDTALKRATVSSFLTNSRRPK